MAHNFICDVIGITFYSFTSSSDDNILCFHYLDHRQVRKLEGDTLIAAHYSELHLTAHSSMEINDLFILLS